MGIIPPNYTYCIAFDTMLDSFFWGWQSWTSDLEEALLELLVSVNEELTEVLGRFKTMMRGFPSIPHGITSQSNEEQRTNHTREIENLLETVTSDLHKALCERSAYAVGRLHQTLTQFVEVASMMGIPESFVRSLNRFVQAKIESSDTGVIVKSMTSLVNLFCSMLP
jgi:hypothetical protein